MGTVKAIDTKENERVRVIVRCRPMNLKELRKGYGNVVDVHRSVGAIEIFNPKENDEGKTFTFDAVYDCDSTQDDIYQESVKPVVDSVLSGFNGTIFAYGQTGTGKTFTMEGSRFDPLCKGVIPKSFEQIFNHIVRSQNTQYLVRASYIEIYQEEVQDLLDGSGKTCYELRGNSSNVFIKNLKSHVCKSAKEMEEVMHHGNRNRKIGKTDMNDHSSRSHAIFIITVEMSKTVSGIYQVRVGKLNLVDLAGSERQSKSCSSGERLKEATKINLSLSALGNVISALSSGKSLHIPYRDSKLTRLLQDSLGGNSKTLMIANIGPASYNYDESLTTLRYANRAKNIKNKPRINEDLKDTLIREYQNEIKRLKALLQSKLANKIGNESTGNSRNSEINRIRTGNMNVRNSMIRKQLQQSIKSTSMCDDDKAIRLKEEEMKEKNLQALSAEKKVIHALKERIKLMESKLLNGTNMVDHTNAQKEILQHCADEIKQKTKFESELRQRLLQEEKTTEQLKQSIRNLQNQIKELTEAIDDTFYKFQAVKKQTIEIIDDFDGDREGLEKVQNNSIKNYKLNQIIVDNFISEHDVKNFTSNLYYDEENKKWTRYQQSVDIHKQNSSMQQNENKPEDECIRVQAKVNS